MTANSTTHGRGSVTIAVLDAEDWEYDTDGGFNANIGMLVSSIQFIPSAASDRMIIHDGGVDAAEIFDSGVTAGVSPIFKNFDPPRWIRPVIDQDDCTFGSTGQSVIIDYV
jgi:hypothetical protein